MIIIVMLLKAGTTPIPICTPLSVFLVGGFFWNFMTLIFITFIGAIGLVINGYLLCVLKKSSRFLFHFTGVLFMINLITLLWGVLMIFQTLT
ncbi:hypothetical protein [Vibrio jasicida]|uniref:hypothetical protein n=1 Tax=Vibrio jasicida TaxID=766224 RepID=UPI0012E0A53D|nr:hypothetical protein [Vibrio jasicida]